MANLTPANSFDDVIRLETTDVVVGGVGGKSNVQGQQLLNRTEWLKNQVIVKAPKRAIEQIATGGTINIEADDFSENKIVCISGDADPAMVVVLPEIADFDDSTIGWSIAFKNCGQFDDNGAQQGFGINLKVKCDGVEAFLVSEGAMPSGGPLTDIDLALGDILELTIFKAADDSFWFFVTMHEKNRIDDNKTGRKDLSSVAGDVALTLADIKKVLVIGLASAGSYRLPAISTVPDNTRVHIMYGGAGLNNCAIKNNAADGGGNIVFNSVESNTQLLFTNAKHTAELLKLGNKWYAIQCNI